VGSAEGVVDAAYVLPPLFELSTTAKPPYGSIGGLERSNRSFKYDFIDSNPVAYLASVSAFDMAESRRTG
jgi:hypothetical protein